MGGRPQLSPGGAAALITLPQVPQDVRVTIQVKEKLCGSHFFTVSDGVNWVPAIFLSDFRFNLDELLEPMQIVTITKAYFHESWGAVFVEEGIVHQDEDPEHIFGDPKALIPEVVLDRVFPIACLEYCWEHSCFSPIRALVTYKSELYEDITCGGDAPFFMVHLLDETGEIRAHASSTAARELYDRFEEGKVYDIHDFTVVHNSYCPFYNLTHRFKILFTRRTVIKECCETANVPLLRFDFTPLSQIIEGRGRIICDVIGVVTWIGSVEYTQNSKTGQKLAMCSVIIVDQSEIHFKATLWAKNAEEFDVPKGTVVAFRRVKVDDDTEGRYLSVLSPSTIHIEPHIKEADVIRNWYGSFARRRNQHDSLSQPTPQPGASRH